MPNENAGLSVNLTEAAVRKQMRRIVEHYQTGAGAALVKTMSVRGTEADIKKMQEYLTHADFAISVTPQLGDVEARAAVRGLAFLCVFFTGCYSTPVC